MKQNLRPTRIVVFEQDGAGQYKIHGIREHGRDIEIEAVFSVDENLPQFVDEPEKYISNEFSGDLVLDFLTHPDLSEYLVSICRTKDIPVVASGKKIKGALTPFTCCGLRKIKRLGHYGEQFGIPEFKVDTAKGRVIGIEVVRGAPCGATWQVVSKIIGLPIIEAVSTIAREAQYICKADPSNFDPLSSKSPLHYAGDVHAAALRKALKQPATCNI